MTSTSREFNGWDRIYSLSDPLASRPFRGSLQLDSGAEAYALTRGELVPATPVTVTHASGGQPSDVIWTTYAIPLLVNSRVVDILSDGGFTGWSTYEVSVFSRAADEIKGYRGLAITGRCGPLDYSKSDVFLRQFPAGAFPAYRGLYFDVDTWDGSDLLMPEGSGHIFVVEAVKRALQRASVRNIRFTKLSEEVTDRASVSRFRGDS